MHNVTCISQSSKQTEGGGGAQRPPPPPTTHFQCLVDYKINVMYIVIVQSRTRYYFQYTVLNWRVDRNDSEVSDNVCHAHLQLLIGLSLVVPPKLRSSPPNYMYSRSTLFVNSPFFSSYSTWLQLPPSVTRQAPDMPKFRTLASSDSTSVSPSKQNHSHHFRCIARWASLCFVSC